MHGGTAGDGHSVTAGHGHRGRARTGLGTRTWLVAAAAAILAAASPAQPTGSPVADVAFLAAGTAAVVLVGATAPWWAAAVAAGAALAIAGAPLLMLLAALALAAALWAGARRRDRPEVLAASLGLTLNVLARAELDARFGATALISGAVIALVVLTGFLGQTSRARKVTFVGAALVAVALGVATAGFGAAAAQSRGDLAGGLRWAEQGVSSLENGDFEGAAESFRSASEVLATANERMSKPWTSAAAFVPVVAQHRSAVLDMSGVGADGAATVAEALEEIDLDALRTVDGRFDLAELTALEGPLSRVREALDDLQQTTQAARSPWLVNRADYELDDFESSIEEHLPALENSLQAIDLAPDMLGAGEPRTYLVLFTTPSESRGLGGFIGSYGELTIDDGRLTLSNFGRAQDLDAAAVQAGARVEGHEAFLRQYGRFGYGDDGAVGNAAFRNLAMSPDFPTVAEIGASLYEQTTGREVDGVIAMDPFVVSALVRYVGTIDLPTVGVQLDAGSAIPYLLLDQYVLGAADNDTRADGLAEAASLTFDALLGGALPDPITLVARPRSADQRAATARLERRSRGAGAAGARPCRRVDPRERRLGRLGGHRVQRRRQQDRPLPPAPGELRDVHRRERRDDGDAARRAHQQRAGRGLPALRHRQPSGPAERHQPVVRLVLQPPRPDRRHARRGGDRADRRRGGRVERVLPLRRHPARRDRRLRRPARRHGGLTRPRS